MKVLGMVNVGFDKTYQLLIGLFAIKILEKDRQKDRRKTVHQLFTDFSKAYDSLRRGVLYSILIEFGVPMKLARLISHLQFRLIAIMQIKIAT
jgi:hypothetical protein